MEYIDGKPLKDFIGSSEYYDILKQALYNAYLLDEKGVFHGQLGRYYHILKTNNDVKFIDFERGVFSKNPRNFMQIIGYYFFRDEKFDVGVLKEIVRIYKTNPKKALEKILKVADV